MNRQRNGFVQILIALLILGIAAIICLTVKVNSLNNIIYNRTPVPSSTLANNQFGPSTPAPTELIYQGDPSNTNWKEFTLDGCSANDIPLKYIVMLPASWTITRIHASFDDGNYIAGRNPPGNFSYMAIGNGSQFSIMCMSDGIRGGGCGLGHTTFNINGKRVDACVGEYEGKYHMGTDYINSELAKSTTEFSSEGIDLQTLNKIFSTFKFN